jgi:hypothetical protein
LARVCFETVPVVLGKVGKIKNPYPNVDAYSGSLLQHYGKYLINFQVWYKTISIHVFSVYQELWDAFRMVSGQEHLVFQSKDQTVSTLHSCKNLVVNNDLYINLFIKLVFFLIQ